MFNSQWLKNMYDSGRLMVVISRKPRKSGHIAHLLRKDERKNEWYEISTKTGREIRNYVCWWQIEDWIRDGEYKEIDIKKEAVNCFWKEWFLMELIDAVKEVR